MSAISAAQAQPPSAARPGSRFGHAMVYYAPFKVMFTFGGWGFDSCPSGSTTSPSTSLCFGLLNDAWTFSTETLTFAFISGSTKVYSFGTFPSVTSGLPTSSGFPTATQNIRFSQGDSATTNGHPGARMHYGLAADFNTGETSTSASHNIWLYGGYGCPTSSLTTSCSGMFVDKIICNFFLIVLYII